MARGKPETSSKLSDPANELIGELQKAGTSGELWKIGGAEDFKTRIAALPENEQQDIRDTFLALDILLKGKVKAEDIANIALDIPPMGWDFPNPSSRFPDSKFVVIKGVRTDTGEKFELLSGAKRIYRFFENADPQVRQHIMLVQETPEEMTARNATAGTSPMWIVKRLAAGERKTGRTSPF